MIKMLYTAILLVAFNSYAQMDIKYINIDEVKSWPLTADDNVITSIEHGTEDWANHNIHAIWTEDIIDHYHNTIKVENGVTTIMDWENNIEYAQEGVYIYVKRIN